MEVGLRKNRHARSAKRSNSSVSLLGAAVIGRVDLLQPISSHLPIAPHHAKQRVCPAATTTGWSTPSGKIQPPQVVPVHPVGLVDQCPPRSGPALAHWWVKLKATLTLAEALHWSAVARFSTSFLAIVPLAKLLGDATEQVSIPLGQTLGGLLNASFGNAVELIVAIAALAKSEHCTEGADGR